MQDVSIPSDTPYSPPKNYEGSLNETAYATKDFKKASLQLSASKSSLSSSLIPPKNTWGKLVYGCKSRDPIFTLLYRTPDQQNTHFVHPQSMSFQPPPPPGGAWASQPGLPGQQHADLAANLQGLSLGRTKKKRSARAYHTEFNSPVGSQPPSPRLHPMHEMSKFQPPTHQFLSQPHLDHTQGLGPYTPTDMAYQSQPTTPFQPPNAVFSPGGPSSAYAGSPLAANVAAGLPLAAVPGSPFQPTTPAPVNEVSVKDLSLPALRHWQHQEYAGDRSFLTFQNVVPPPAGTQFHAVDQGTASSKFIRATMYNVPETEQLRQATKLPVAVTIRPFAPQLVSEDKVPVSDVLQLGVSGDPDDAGPPRCRRCRTYMNPSMQHSHGNRFSCNICQFPNNSVPFEYESLTDPSTGQRIDRALRPELHRGVYDFAVPSTYNLGGAGSENAPLHHVLLIDISELSIKQLLPTVVADAIRATLYNYEEDPEAYDDVEADSGAKRTAKFAIITFDKRLHFYNLSPSLDATQLLVLADLDDPFVPFDEGLFADPEASRMVIEDVLNNLEQLSLSHIAEPEPCFAVALRTAAMCLQKVGGGKITSVLAALPSWGPGALKFKDNRAVASTTSAELEKRVFLPDNDYYKLLAKDLVAQNVGVDVLVVSHTAVDLSNIGWLASVTGGSVHRWPNFNFERDGRNFTSHFVNSVKKTAGYQGQLKMRCSNGLQVAQYYGTSANVAESTVVGASVAVATGVHDPVIPVLNEDDTFTVLFEYDGKLNTKFDCHFQAALLYTDPAGIRKVRVINLVLAVSERLQDVFSFVEEDAVITTLVRDTLSFVGKQPMSELRDSINLKLVDVFTQYRALSETSHNRNRALTNQLLFPDLFKHLPLYILSFIKSRAIKDSARLTADVRLADVFLLLKMPVERLVYYLYPALVELHSLDETDCMVGESENPHQFIKLPQFKELTANKLEYGVYVLCNGQNVYVWIHPEANILLLKDLFGEEIETVDHIDPLMDELPELPTHISQQARNLIQYFQNEIVGASKLVGNSSIQIIREGIDNLMDFKESLVEDSLKGTVESSIGPSYPDYLNNLHRAIRVKLDNDKSSNKLRQSVKEVEHTDDTLAQRLLHF